MRLAPMLLGLTLSLGLACSRGDDAEGAAPDAAASADAAPVSAPYAGHDYACSDGLTFNARMAGGNALLTLEGKTYTLSPVAGAAGAQYSGEDLLFMPQGNEARLQRAGGTLLSCQAK